MKEWMALNGSDCPRVAIGKMEKSRKEKSWTQETCEALYRSMRRGVDCEDMLKYWHEPPELIHAADYSYQAKDYELHGWSSEMRRKRYFQIIWRVLAESEVIPF